MKLIRNSGNDRLIDRLRDWLAPGSAIDLMSPTFSVHAFAETREFLDKADRCRLLLGDSDALPGALFGGSSDTAFRGRLQGRWLARLAADWIKKHSEIRHVPSTPLQSLILVMSNTRRALLGTCSFTTEGLGITPGGQMGLVQATDTEEEAAAFAEWFRSNWDGIKPDPDAKECLAELLAEAGSMGM
jgi:hypothetical protein